MRVRLPALCLPLALLAFAIDRPARAADPTVSECLEASNTSVKLRSEHKLRQSRAQLLVCTSGSCPAEVRDECARRMDLLTAAIPTVVFEVKDPSGRELSAVKVSMDAEVVADHLDGTSLSLDPGSHEFTFEAPGQPPATQTLILHEGDKNRHVPVMVGTPLPAPPPTPPPAQPSAEPPAQPQEAGVMRPLGVVIGATGLVALAAGGTFGGLTYYFWGQANSDCASHVACSSQATSQRANAVTFSTLSDVTFIAGGVLAAAGITFYVLGGPKAPSPPVGLQVAPGGLGVVGKF